MRIPLAALLLAALLGLVACQRPAPDPPTAPLLRIAAAANLQFALPALIDAFQRQHPDLRVEATYGSSGNLKTQIEQGAPFDLLLSADTVIPEALVASGAAAEVFPYAAGQLVLWVRNDSPLDLDKSREPVLLNPAVHKIAIANPRHAPFGTAAIAALRHFQIYEAVEPKLVLGENVAQAAQFVESGAADAGLIAQSLALAPAMKSQGRALVIPADAHPPILQAGVIVAASPNPTAATQFRDFLTSPTGLALLAQSGFLPPAAP